MTRAAARLVAAVVLLLLATAGCARDEARPEGIAERWLHAVSDHGRDGLRDDAEARMREHGDPALAARIVPPDAEEDERTFSDLEVGKAIVVDGTARVPFRASARVGGDERREVAGTLLLANADGHWLVTGLQPRADGEQVPSEGGDRPAGANLGQWAVAMLAGLALTVVSVVLIDAQPGAKGAQRR